MRRECRKWQWEIKKLNLIQLSEILLKQLFLPNMVMFLCVYFHSFIFTRQHSKPSQKSIGALGIRRLSHCDVKEQPFSSGCPWLTLCSWGCEKLLLCSSLPGWAKGMKEGMRAQNSIDENPRAIMLELSTL